MTVSHQLVSALARVSAERMVDSLVVGLALAVLAWTLLRLLPRQNSATRFALWFAALIATALLPFLNSAPKASPLMQAVSPSARPLISVPASWALYLFAFWAAMAAISLARLGIGLVELRRLRRQCRAIEGADPDWREIGARVCPARQVEILTSDRIAVPTAIGFFRPAIILPAGLLRELTPSELKHVLLHEFAHLRRWDDWTNLVQKLVKAVLFFHPAVWWMENRISLEREMACDDAVLAETASPRAYAECLATLAEKSLLRRGAALAQGAVNRIRQTSLRVAQILDPKRSTAPVRKSAVALVAAFTLVCGAVAWRVPPIVGFESAPAESFVWRGSPARGRLIPTSAVATNPSPVLAAAAPAPSADSRAFVATKPRMPVPKATMAKAAVTSESSSNQRNSTARFIENGSRAPRVFPAKAAAPQPEFRTGVVVIFVNDPVFGPTPIFWHFAVWQVRPRHAEAAVPQKNI